MNDVNLHKFLSLVKRRVFWLFFGMILGLLIMMFLSLMVIPKQYKSYIQLYVTVSERDSNSSLLQSSEIAAAEKLANTCSVILKNDDILQKVVDKLNQDIAVKYVKNSLTIKVVSGTQVLDISSVTNNAILSEDICNTIAKIAPEELKNVMDCGYAKAIGSATIPNSASSPNVINNSLIGAFIGLVIAMIIVFIIELSDDTIKTTDAFKERFNIPVLGEIPSFNEKERCKYGKHKRDIRL